MLSEQQPWGDQNGLAFLPCLWIGISSGSSDCKLSVVNVSWKNDTEIYQFVFKFFCNIESEGHRQHW